MKPLLDELKGACQDLGIQYKEGEAELGDGSKCPILHLKHGHSELVAREMDGRIQLVALVHIKAEVAERIGGARDDLKDQLVFYLRRELLNGRTGFKLLPEKVPEGSFYRGIQIEQEVYVERGSQSTYQRLLDAKYELVAAALRAMGVLQTSLADVEAWEDMKNSADPHDPAYH